MKSLKNCWWMFLLFLGTSCSNENDDVLNEDSQGVRTNIELDVQQRSIVASGNTFSNKMLIETMKENENTLISPFSLQVVLGMLANGANEEAYNEIVTVLGLENYSLAELNEYYRKVFMGVVEEQDPKIDLSLANSVWLQEGSSVLDEYVNRITGCYGTPFYTVDFTDVSGTKAKIDRWANEETNSTIKNLGLPITEATKMVLVNALYFAGKWTSPFSETNTIGGTFTCEDGTEQKVSFMCGLKKSVAYTETENYQYVSLPFGNESFSMNFLLPREGKVLMDVLSETEWMVESDMQKISVDMELPKFKLETTKELGQTLQGMGITEIFKNGGLSGIADGLAVSFVQQNAYLEIDESGVEASSVTSSGLVESAPTVELAEMNFDRPFAFSICENSSGAVLFMGKIAKIK